MKAMLFDRWGEFLHELQVYECTQFEEINGEDYIDLTTDEPLSKGDRVVWDDDGTWREHVFNEGVQVHESSEGGQRYTVTCENSLMWDLSLRHIKYARWQGADCKYAITEILKLNPTWTVGEVRSTGAKTLEYERESAYQALLETCGTFNCEIRKEITVDKTKVVKRTLSLVEHIGRTTEIRFDYGNGLYGVTKTINADDVITACFGYGSNVDGEDITCYVTDDEALRLWGLPDGTGQVMHAEGQYTNGDIENESELRAETANYLSQHSAPSITYETKIPFVALEGARLGDTVAVVDTDFNPPMRLYTRIGAMERDLVSGLVTNAVFGNVLSLLPDALARTFQQDKIIVRQNGTIGNLKADLQSTRDSLEASQRDLSSARGDISDLQSELRDARSDLSAAQSELSSTKSELESAKKDLATTQDALEYAQQDLQTALDDAAAAKQQANDLASRLKTAEGTIDSQSKQIDDLRADLDSWIEDNELKLRLLNGYQYTGMAGRDLGFAASEVSGYITSAGRNYAQSAYSNNRTASGWGTDFDSIADGAQHLQSLPDSDKSPLYAACNIANVYWLVKGQGYGINASTQSNVRTWLSYYNSADPGWGTGITSMADALLAMQPDGDAPGVEPPSIDPALMARLITSDDPEGVIEEQRDQDDKEAD